MSVHSPTQYMISSAHTCTPPVTVKLHPNSLMNSASVLRRTLTLTRSKPKSGSHRLSCGGPITPTSPETTWVFTHPSPALFRLQVPAAPTLLPPPQHPQPRQELWSNSALIPFSPFPTAQNIVTRKTRILKYKSVP